LEVEGAAELPADLRKRFGLLEPGRGLGVKAGVFNCDPYLRPDGRQQGHFVFTELADATSKDVQDPNETPLRGEGNADERVEPFLLHRIGSQPWIDPHVFYEERGAGLRHSAGESLAKEHPVGLGDEFIRQAEVRRNAELFTLQQKDHRGIQGDHVGDGGQRSLEDLVRIERLADALGDDTHRGDFPVIAGELGRHRIEAPRQVNQLPR